MLGHARLDTTQIYTHVSIKALTEVHARSHPHGRMEEAETETTADQERECEENSASPNPPHELLSDKEMIATPPSATAVAVVAKPTTDTHQPGDDDVDPGTGVTATSPRPRPPRPGNASRSRFVRPQKPSKLAENAVHIADYGKRYYEPLTGRWHSKDPIGEKGGVNLYLFCNNDAIVSFDILGMLCPVTFEVSGTPNGTVYRAAKTYPIFDGLLYEVPIYNLIVKKVLKKGQAETEQQSKTFQVIRFMPYLNPSKQKDKRYKLVKDEVAMIGLADTTTYTIPEYKDYELHSTDLGENGAFVLQGTHYIHDGPNDDTEVFGSAGCLEVFGKEGMEALKKIVAEYSESKKNTVTEQLKELASAGLLKAKLEKAQRPAVKVSPLKIQQQ
jgi:RHS repeat-associated protein